MACDQLVYFTIFTLSPNIYDQTFVLFQGILNIFPAIFMIKMHKEWRYLRLLVVLVNFLC